MGTCTDGAFSSVSTLIGVLGAGAGCASTPNSTSGANTLEGGVKIPAAAATTLGIAHTTVHVTLGDTQGPRPDR